ncbi:hypothetical protein L1887_47803 [Cichorium endivia]|nr:hypothetical protein L1887_47803 [Cichorium endivia]
MTASALSFSSRSRPALELDVLADAVGDVLGEALVDGHLALDFGPGRLVELVDGGADGADLVGRDAADVKDAVEDLAVVDLDGEALDAEGVERLDEDAEHLGVGNHGVVDAGDVDVALVELAEAALGHGGLVATVDLGDVVALDVAVLGGVHGDEAGKGHGEIVAQRAELATLVLEVVDELGVLAVLAGEDLLELEDGRVDGDGAVGGEDVFDGGEDALAQRHGERLPVARALGRLEGELDLLLGRAGLGADAELGELRLELLELADLGLERGGLGVGGAQLLDLVVLLGACGLERGRSCCRRQTWLASRNAATVRKAGRMQERSSDMNRSGAWLTRCAGPVLGWKMEEEVDEEEDPEGNRHKRVRSAIQPPFFDPEPKSHTCGMPSSRAATRQRTDTV